MRNFQRLCTVWMGNAWLCFATGTSTIQSVIRFEIRSWGMIWTTYAISSTTCGTGDVDNLLHGALLNALLGSIRIWTQPPKITILAYVSQFPSRRVDIECVRGITSSISSLEYPKRASWSTVPTSRSSLPTLTPPSMSGLCLFMRMAPAAIRSASDRHSVRGRQSSCAKPRSWHRAARPNTLDLSALSVQRKQDLSFATHTKKTLVNLFSLSRFLYLGLTI